MEILSYASAKKKTKRLKGQVQGSGWFLTRFPLKLAENSDVGETLI